jgi:hypothetical protein
MSDSVDRRFLLGGFAGAAGAAAFAGLAKAGPLNPPAGAITSTSKPLDELEPRTAVNATNTPGNADYIYRITQPGSYYLTGNVVAQFSKGGIEIASSDVTLDLMGFAVIGASLTDSGIGTPSAVCDRVVVRNGTVTGWSIDGVRISSGTVCVVENVNSINNGNAGFRLGTTAPPKATPATASSPPATR